MKAEILCGDAEAVLSRLPAESVDCVVTSPPYWGLRNYQVEGQIGLESSFTAYLDRLVAVFNQVKRVLKSSGTMWVNHGDSFVNDGGAGWQGRHGGRAGRRHTQNRLVVKESSLGLAEKNLIGQPWRIAFALQERGWILRQEIIWLKPSPMPESAKDRPTRAHEQIFLFAKSDRYVYDDFAVMETATGNAHKRGGEEQVDLILATRNCRSVWRIPAQPFVDEWCTACKTLYSAAEKRLLERHIDENGKKHLICRCGRRDAWIAHFATFPRTLAERCIKAGSSEHGCCGMCGAPYRRLVRRPKVGDLNQERGGKAALGVKRLSKTRYPEFYPHGKRRLHKSEGLRQLTDVYRDNHMQHGPGWRSIELPRPEHLGWKQTCSCSEVQGTLFEAIRPAVVLDPFCGAATTLLVAESLGRQGVGVELNPDFAEMAEARLARERRKSA